MEAKWYLGMETKGGGGNFNGEREVLESLPVRTEMTGDKFLSSGLSVGSTFLFCVMYCPIMAPWVTVKLAIWISFLKVLPSFLRGNSST